MKLVRIKTEIGTPNATYGPIRDQMESYICVDFAMRKIGIRVICTGMHMHATITE